MDIKPAPGSFLAEIHKALPSLQKTMAPKIKAARKKDHADHLQRAAMSPRATALSVAAADPQARIVGVSPDGAVLTTSGEPPPPS